VLSYTAPEKDSEVRTISLGEYAGDAAIALHRDGAWEAQGSAVRLPNIHW
jgi:hypothetical protein